MFYISLFFFLLTVGGTGWAIYESRRPKDRVLAIKPVEFEGNQEHLWKDDTMIREEVKS